MYLCKKVKEADTHIKYGSVKRERDEMNWNFCSISFSFSISFCSVKHEVVVVSGKDTWGGWQSYCMTSYKPFELRTRIWIEKYIAAQWQIPLLSSQDTTIFLVSLNFLTESVSGEEKSRERKTKLYLSAFQLWSLRETLRAAFLSSLSVSSFMCLICDHRCCWWQFY